MAWAPDGGFAAGGDDQKVRVYDKAGLAGLGGWFLSYCATPLVLSCLPRCEEPCCCWPLTASNPLQNETATIATANPALKGNGFWTVIQTLQCCGRGPEVPEEVRCADGQVLHGALLVGFGNFWIKGCSATCVCAFFIFFCTYLFNSQVLLEPLPLLKGLPLRCGRCCTAPGPEAHTHPRRCGLWDQVPGLGARRPPRGGGC